VKSAWRHHCRRGGGRAWLTARMAFLTRAGIWQTLSSARNSALTPRERRHNGGGVGRRVQHHIAGTILLAAGRRDGKARRGLSSPRLRCA